MTALDVGTEKDTKLVELTAGLVAATANFAYPEFECSNCKTITIAVRRNLSNSSPIVCSRCGTFLGTWGDLKGSTTNLEAVNGKVFDVS